MKEKFIIYINKEFYEEQALVHLEEDGSYNVIMQGDYYHDKIEILIQGFFKGLDFCNKYGNESNYNISTKTINHKDDMFKELCFNQEDFD